MLLVDKPAGPTSHDACTVVRRAFQTRRVGHAGTLDPFATGLLIVLVGRCTRLAQFLVGLPKTYTATIRLGLTTTTDDLNGEPLRASTAWEALSEEAIRLAMASLTGVGPQRPPRFSAKSVDGKRAYHRARRGEEFELEPQDVEVTRLELVRRDGADLAVEASVSSGTYVRALARDLGERLECGAHLAALRRTSVGPFRLEDAVTLDQVGAGTAELRPGRDVVNHLPRREIDDTERLAIRQGRAIPGDPSFDGPVALVSSNDLVAIANPVEGTLRPTVVLES